MSQLFASGSQSIGISASASVLPMNIQDWFSLGWTGWISLQSKALSRVFSNTTVQKHQFFHNQLSLYSNSHVHGVSEAIQASHPLSLPSACLQSFPSSGFFSNESVLHIRCQSIGDSASASVLPMNIQDWFPLGWTGWISLQSKGLSRVFSNNTVQKHQIFGLQPSLWSSCHIHGLLLENPYLWLDRPMSAK